MNKIFRATTAAFALASALALGACAETRTRESTGDYVDNAAITAKVKAAILQDPVVKVMQIHVTTYKDVVQLSGFVDTAQMKARAGTVASQVAGVSSVKNDLVVKSTEAAPGLRQRPEGAGCFLTRQAGSGDLPWK